MTQKELILAWGSGEKGEQSQLSELSMEELILTYRQLKAISITSQTANVKVNLALIIREVRQRIHNGETMYYLACESGYPYQESSNYGTTKIDTNMLSVRLFPVAEDAEKAADSINRRTNSLGEKRGREIGDIVYVEHLGNSAYMDAVSHLEQMGVNAVFFGEKKDEKTDLNLRAETLVRRTLPPEEEFSASLFKVSPKAYAMLSIIEQAENEKRPEEEITQYRGMAIQLAASGQMGIAIPPEDYEAGESLETLHPLTYTVDDVEYLEVFTDWVSMIDCLGDDKQVYMAVGNWDNIIQFGLPVMINRQTIIPSELVSQIGCYTEMGRLAMAYIADSYKLNITTEDGMERCQNILNDIRAARPVCAEFYAGLSTATRKLSNGKDETYAVLNFPEENLVTVNGHTAKQFVDNNLCATPAAAYHVLATLYNDTDGSAQRAFENAELYE